MMKKSLMRLLSALVCAAMLLGGIPVYSEESIENEVAATQAPTPAAEPTAAPTAEPTAVPTEAPTDAPTAEPTEAPIAEPTEEPTAEPSAEPTAEPTTEPTAEPDQQALLDAEVAAWMQKLRAAKPENELESALWLYEKLIDRAAPDKAADAPDTAAAVLLDGRGSSLGYARAMECLLDAAGIKNLLIYKADDRSVAWNAARLDGVWTHIDAYADDAARTPHAENA